MKQAAWILLAGGLFGFSGLTTGDGNALLGVEVRRAELEQPAFAPARAACLAVGADVAETLPEPIAGLKGTKAYGSDTSAEDFSWVVMVLSGRALAGDEASGSRLAGILSAWASAGAFMETEASHDAYYALKRVLLPVIVGYTIVAEDMPFEEQESVTAWLDTLVRRIDKKFDGDVDHNNHRYLADSVLMAWGNYRGDEALYEKGMARFREALRQADRNGTLLLEVRRGARATWYMRQSLASLTVMAEIARLNGDDLYEDSRGGKTIDRIMNYYLDAVYNPLVIIPDAAANYIPGPSKAYLEQDHGMLRTRGHGRHYMAFSEAYLRFGPESFTTTRLAQLMARTGWQERPLLDEFSGGNATCFWWKPTGEQS